VVAKWLQGETPPLRQADDERVCRDPLIVCNHLPHARASADLRLRHRLERALVMR